MFIAYDIIKVTQFTVFLIVLFYENLVIQKQSISDEDGDKLGNKAYRLRIHDDEEENDILISKLSTQLSKLHVSSENETSEYESDGFSDSDDECLSHTQTPPLDDTKRKYLAV